MTRDVRATAKKSVKASVFVFSWLSSLSLFLSPVNNNIYFCWFLKDYRFTSRRLATTFRITMQFSPKIEMEQEFT